MKRYFVNTALALTGFLALGLTSCLKDKEFEDGSIQSVHNGGDEIKVVELGVAGTSSTATAEGGSSIVYGLNAANSDTTFGLIPVILATSGPAEEDINVTLAPAPELVDSFNNFNGTAAQVPTSTMYSVLNAGNVVTIPRGSNVGYLRVKLNPNDFLGQDWALAYKIVSVDRPGYVISSNNRTALALITIKNRYDGLYRITLKVDGWLAYGISSVQGTYPGNYELITAGTNSVEGNATARGDFLQPAFGGDATTITSNTAFGSTYPKFTFDLNTNKITSAETTLFPNAQGRVLRLNTAPPPAGVAHWNEWDPTTGNVYASMILSQPGRPDATITETLTYLRPR